MARLKTDNLLMYGESMIVRIRKDGALAITISAEAAKSLVDHANAISKSGRVPEWSIAVNAVQETKRK